MKTPHLVRVLAAISLVTLAGCTSTTAPRAPSPEPTSASASTTPTQASPETPSPTYTSTIVPSPPLPSATPGQLVITTAGYGDLRVGSPVPAATRLARWEADLCGPDSGAWVPAEWHKGDDTEYVIRTDERKRGGAITTLIFYSPDIQTKSGARPGMSTDALKDLFPGLPVLGTHHDSTLFGVTDDLGTVEFEAYEGGDNIVLDIMVLSPGTKPFGIGSTDGGSYCPA